MTRLSCGTISAVGKKRTADNTGPAGRAAAAAKKKVRETKEEGQPAKKQLKQATQSKKTDVSKGAVPISKKKRII